MLLNAFIMPKVSTIINMTAKAEHIEFAAIFITIEELLRLYQAFNPLLNCKMYMVQ